MNIVASRPGRRPGAERPVVIAWLAVLAALCWAALLFYNPTVPATPPAPDGVASLTLPAPPPYHPADLVPAFGLWVAATWAMMLPGATPVVLAFARVNLLYRAVRWPYFSTALFLAGYLAVLSLFAAIATVAQWGLHDGGMLDAALALTNSTAAGLALVAAGVYQWTPAKHACLHQCRVPLASMLTGWLPGPWGAFRMGVAHGLDCIGCCWLLSALLFAAGVTSLLAVAALGMLMLVEKILPGGTWIACIAGLGMVAWSTLLLFP